MGNPCFPLEKDRQGVEFQNPTASFPHGIHVYLYILFWEIVWARNLVFFRVKWLRPAMKGTSCVLRLLLGSF